MRVNAATTAQAEILKVVEEFRLDRPCTPVQLQDWWKRLQCANRRAGEVELPCQSYDAMMEESLARVREVEVGRRNREQQQQQQQ